MIHTMRAGSEAESETSQPNNAIGMMHDARQVSGAKRRAHYQKRFENVLHISFADKSLELWRIHYPKMSYSAITMT